MQSVRLVLLFFGAMRTGLQQATSDRWVRFGQTHVPPMLQIEVRSIVPDCIKSWSLDGSHKLGQSTLRWNPRAPINFSTYSETANVETEGLFVFPEHNFAFCLIPKVGTSMWADVFLKMATDNVSAAGKTEWSKYATQFRGTVEDKTKIFSDPHTTRAVFIRDPLARFTANFFNKCGIIGDPFNACLAGEPGQVSMRILTGWMEHSDLTLLKGHWSPQAYFCDLENRAEEYTFIGVYEEETFGENAACLMELGAIEKYNTMGPGLNNTPIWGRTDMSACPAPNPYHLGSAEEEVNMMKKLFTTRAAKVIIEAYKIDYITFNLPEPDWIFEATGELFDKYFHTDVEHASDCNPSFVNETHNDEAQERGID